MKIERVRGTHNECGIQVGEIFAEHIRSAIEEMRRKPMPGQTWGQMLELAQKYWQETLAAYPFIIGELSGVAKGAGVDPIELFAYMVEEIWVTPIQEARACSDIILTAPLTDGRVIVGHNNDVLPAMGKLMFPVEWNFDDGSKILIVGPLGFYVSVGVNSYGIALTGNELTPTDNKMGVPRSIIARAILSAESADEAIKIATDSRRASSYNNIISTRGGVVDVEGSGTAFDTIGPMNGVLVHTNHYICETMRRFEGKPNYTSSIERLKHGQEMVLGKGGQKLTSADVEKMLADHRGGSGDDNTICRHGEGSVTAFGIVVDFGDGAVRLAMSTPCQNKFERIWEIASK